MKYCIFLFLLLAAPSWAQIVYSPAAGGTYAALDGASVVGAINVRLEGCPAGPWTFAVDGVARAPEKLCPMELGGDNYLLSLAPGAHEITATGPSTYTARFTVGTTPDPPTDPVVTGKARLDWILPTTCDAGTRPITECPTLGFEIEQARAATGPWTSIHTTSPTATSYQMTGLEPGLYFWRLYTVTLEDIRSNPTEPVSFTVVAETCVLPKPADEMRANQCTAPAVGSWTQTLTYTQATYPICWSAGEWLPASAPSGACVVPPPKWVVADSASGTRPVVEPVLNFDGNAVVRGTEQGRVKVRTPCGEQSFVSGRNSYRYVDERDVVLDSPTYQGREHVAICVQP